MHVVRFHVMTQEYHGIADMIGYDAVVAVCRLIDY